MHSCTPNFFELEKREDDVKISTVSVEIDAEKAKKAIEEQCQVQINEIRKETAREILQELYETLKPLPWSTEYQLIELSEKYGVEVEELKTITNQRIIWQ